MCTKLSCFKRSYSILSILNTSTGLTDEKLTRIIIPNISGSGSNVNEGVTILFTALPKWSLTNECSSGS